ncbi:MAG: hypothetical protein ND895_16980 [Pyrinomonadaceae bacterium]|nr:hypothetical protein [Pyrinomonadaceae bacterium]
MYCPNCGNQFSTDLKFCRACGLGLEKVTETLVEQLPIKLDESLEEQKNRLEQWGVAALSVFGLGVLGLLLYGIVYKMMITQGRVLGGLALLGLVVMMGCGLLSVVLFAKAQEVEKAKAKRRLSPAEPVTQGEPTRGLLPEVRLDQITSVTERTTDLLFAEKRDAAERR